MESKNEKEGFPHETKEICRSCQILEKGTMYFKEVEELIDQICDLTRKHPPRENIHQQFSIERLSIGYPLEALMKALKALENPLGFFLYPFKALKKAVGKIRPTRCYSTVNSLIYGSD